MSDTPLPSPSADDLQFETAEPASAAGVAAAGQTCVLCKQPIESTYYALGDGLLCPSCGKLALAPAAGGRFGRLIKASLLGLCAGLVGALIWFVIRRVTNYEIGLVAILVGIMVGKAVRKGSAGVGGRGYQLLAVLITYCCIAANYLPDCFDLFMNAARQQPIAIAQPGAEPANPPKEVAQAPAQQPQPDITQNWGVGKWALFLAVVLAFTMCVPFLNGVKNLIGILIIGFALWEAWKLNARRPLPISGPYQLGRGPVPDPVR